MNRVGRVEVSSWPDRTHLPPDVVQAPAQLLLVEHSLDSLSPVWAQWKGSKQGEHQRVGFFLLQDSSAFARQTWNMKVKHALKSNFYWQVDLPTKRVAGGERAIWQLVVIPRDVQAGLWTVRAWLIRKQEILSMLTPRFNGAFSGAEAERASASTTRSNVGPALLPTQSAAASRIQAAPASAHFLASALAPVAASVVAAPIVALPPQINPSQAVAEAAALQQRYQSGGVYMYRALHSLSQHHEEWPFGAVAELLDNALDADAGSVHVDLTCFKQPTLNTLTFRDDGFGMTFDVLGSMLREVGWSSKMGGPDQIGKYGQGFKTGVFRLGAAVIVLTKPRQESGVEAREAATGEPAGAGAAAAAAAASHMSPPKPRRSVPASHASPSGQSSSFPWSVGFLALPGEDCNPDPFAGSEDWNRPVVAHTVQYDEALGLSNSGDAAAAWQEIIKRSPIKSVTALVDHFRQIPSHGTLIIISRLRVFDVEKQTMELQVGAFSGKQTDPTDDIQLKHLRHARHDDSSSSLQSSVRAYVAVLYRKPRMRILVQGQIVHLTNIEATLRRFKGVSNYNDRRQKYKLDLGFSQHFAGSHLKGVMLYNGNRLISPFDFPEFLGEHGYIGVMDTSGIPGIDVANNKQRYVHNHPYIKLSAWIRLSCGKFDEHLQAINEKGQDVLEPESDNVLWIQCTRCRSWRTYPQSAHAELQRRGLLVESANWHCSDNTWDASQASCSAPEPLWDVTDASLALNSSASETDGGKAKLKKAMASIAPATLALTEPRDWSLFVSQVHADNFLGRGTAAEVYQVMDDHRLVALKRFTSGNMGQKDGEKLRKAFERELLTQRMVVHPNVVAALGWVDYPNLCLITEFVSGVNLFAVIHGSPLCSPMHLSTIQKHAILVGTADGMAAIHRENITHGDIKPANIMLEGAVRPTTSSTQSATNAAAACAAGAQPAASSAPHAVSELVYVARICDFGLARRVKQQGQSRTTNQGGSVAGSPAYMAPELHAGDDFSESSTDVSCQSRKAADVWSWAIVAVELLTGGYVSLVHDPAVKEIGQPGSGKLLGPQAPNYTIQLALGRVPWCDPALPAIKPYFDLLRECFARNAAERPSFSQIFKRLQAVSYQELNPDYRPNADQILYRVMSHGNGRESLAGGVRAKLKDSPHRPEDHVAQGSRMSTHFISTTANLRWAIWYWCKLMVESKRDITRCPWIIAVQLQSAHAPRVITHDMRDFLAANFRANFGISADEVLVERHIPADCITAVYDFSRSVWGARLLTFCEKQCLQVKQVGNSIKGYTEWLSAISQRWTAWKQAWLDGTVVRELQSTCRLQPGQYAIEEPAGNAAAGRMVDEAKVADAVASSAATAANAAAAPAVAASTASSASPGLGMAALQALAGQPWPAAAAAGAGSKRKIDDVESTNGGAAAAFDRTVESSGDDDDDDVSSSSSSGDSSAAALSGEDDSAVTDSDGEVKSRKPAAHSAAANKAFKERQQRARSLFETFRRRFYWAEYKSREGAAAFNTAEFAAAARKRFNEIPADQRLAWAEQPYSSPAQRKRKQKQRAAAAAVAPASSASSIPAAAHFPAGASRQLPCAAAALRRVTSPVAQSAREAMGTLVAHSRSMQPSELNLPDAAAASTTATPPSKRARTDDNH